MPRLNQTAAWKQFVEWCQSRGLRPLPANPWTVAAYARWCETRHRYNTIVTFIKAIAREHVLRTRKRPDRHPLVTKTLNLIAQRQEQKREDKAQAAALFQDADFVPTEGADQEAAAEGPARQRVGERTQKAAQGIRRALRSTPKLVSRRPSLT